MALAQRDVRGMAAAEALATLRPPLRSRAARSACRRWPDRRHDNASRAPAAQSKCRQTGRQRQRLLRATDIAPFHPIPATLMAQTGKWSSFVELLGRELIKRAARGGSMPAGRTRRN